MRNFSEFSPALALSISSRRTFPPYSVSSLRASMNTIQTLLESGSTGAIAGEKAATTPVSTSTRRPKVDGRPERSTKSLQQLDGQVHSEVAGEDSAGRCGSGISIAPHSPFRTEMVPSQLNTQMMGGFLMEVTAKRRLARAYAENCGTNVDGREMSASSTCVSQDRLQKPLASR